MSAKQFYDNTPIETADVQRWENAATRLDHVGDSAKIYAKDYTDGEITKLRTEALEYGNSKAEYTFDAATRHSDNALTAHNTDDTAHAELFGEVIDRIREDKADLSAALTAALSAHNTSADSHTDLRDSLSLLQKCLSYKYSVTGGAVQRIDDVSPLEHTANITVHGTTDENGNGVKDPKVNIYGKNLASLSGWENKSQPGNIGYVIAGQTYTLSFTATQSNTEVSSVGFSLRMGSGSNSFDISGTSGTRKYGKITVTFTAPITGNFRYNGYGFITASNVQLEVGNTATEYEEYKEPQMFFAAHEFMQGQSWNLSTSNTVKAISPTMTVIVTDGNSLVNTVDVTYNADLIKRIAALEAAVAALA